MTEDDPEFSKKLDEAAREAFSGAYQRAVDSGAEVAVREGNEIIVLQKIDGQTRKVRTLAALPEPTQDQLDLYDRLKNRSRLRHAKAA